MVTQQTNAAKIDAKLVVTIDGRTVETSSNDWRACCEAVYVLGMEPERQAENLKHIEAKRGKSALESLQAEMNRIEPAFILALNTKDLRREYLARVSRLRGDHIRAKLEKMVVQLWETRKAAS